MAKLSKAQTQLLTHATYNERGIYTSSYQKTIQPLIVKGFLVEISHYRYMATPAGLAYLYQDVPMVDQPQPLSEVEPQPFKVGDLVYYTNAHNHICTATVMKITGDVFTILTSAGGTLERPASDLQIVTGSYNDDLPFTDIGTDFDPEDTQELPIVVDTPAMSLSQLVDAALLGATPCQRIDAMRILRGYDWASVPSDALEAELTDVIEYMMASERSKRSLYRYNMAVATPDSVKAYLHAKRDDIIGMCVYDALFNVYLSRVNHSAKAVQ